MSLPYIPSGIIVAKLSKITEKEFIDVIKNSISIHECLKKLNIKIGGGTYYTFKIKALKLGLDLSHFLGKGYLKGKKHQWKKKTSLENILVENSNYNSHRLKNRLIKEKYFEHKCYNCNRETWNDQLIPIELHHINGDRRDHRMNNIIILCPNCHAQTNNYCARNVETEVHSVKHSCDF